MIIGIDLGTTNSLASVFLNGKVELIPNSLGEFLTPSVISLNDNGELLVGKIAKERLVTHPNVTIAQVKRFMGQPKQIALGAKQFLPEELSACIIRQLVEDAKTYLQQEITEVVVSVPAYFNDAQRKATKTAAMLANVHCERIINEPSAAALAVHHNRQIDVTYVVVDFGGGTLDVSVVDTFDNIIEILAVAGDNHLGGEDFTRLIAEYFIRAQQITPNDELYQIILIEAEKTKLALNDSNLVEMTVHYNMNTYQQDISYDTFFELSKGLLSRLDIAIKRAISDSQHKINGIDEFILVGGTSRLRLVKEFLQYTLKHTINTQVNPERAIGQGCGIVAGVKQRDEDVKDVLLTDICPFSLGTEVSDGTFSVILERNTSLPSSRVERYYAHELGQSKVHFNIYQGEQMIARNNVKLGEFVIPIPVNKEQHEEVQVRFTYDINGILDVDVKVVSTGQVFSTTIIQEDSGLSGEEIVQKRQKLQELKLHPREKNDYHLLIERANRLFMMSLQEKRDLIIQALRIFESAMDTQDTKVVDKAAKDFSKILDSLE